jgi:hypothetical protein
MIILNMLGAAWHECRAQSFDCILSVWDPCYRTTYPSDCIQLSWLLVALEQRINVNSLIEADVAKRLPILGQAIVVHKYELARNIGV